MNSEIVQNAAWRLALPLLIYRATTLRSKCLDDIPSNAIAQVAAVLGAQWGDEGKGKLVDILAKRCAIKASVAVIADSS